VIARARVLLAVLAAALAVVGPSAAAASETWQADPDFRIDTTQVPGSAAGATKAKYLVLGPQGNPTGPLIEVPASSLLDWIEVPSLPGVYEVEAWLENAEGQELRRGSTTLRFDDVAPSPPAPQAPGRWLLGTEPAQLSIGHPDAPLPLSGIRGYAISLDRGSGSSPCGSTGLCTLAETDLPGGIGDDSASLGTLPEGITYARVAAVSGAGVPSPVRTAVFKVDATPPALSLLGLPSGWSKGPVKVTALAKDPLSGMAAAGPSGPFTAIAVDDGAPSLAPGGSATSWVSGSGAHTVAFYARDAAGNVADGAPGAAPPQTARVRIDEEPPRVRFATAQDPSDPERIEAMVSDDLSGPSSSHGTIAVRLAGTRARFEPLPTQVTAGRLIARWDSDSYPPGKYEFLATGFDVAGNAAGGTDRALGGAMVLVNPLKTPALLEAGFAGRRPSGLSRRVRYGRGVHFGGRLQTVVGAPVADLQIAVTEVFEPGSQPPRRTTVTRTGADGSFALRLAPGPSREVFATFAGSRTLTRASSASARLQVPASVRLRASTARARVGGAPVVFSGRVAGTGAAGIKGLPVELQFRYRGSGWSEFRTVETDARGRFRYAYRFSDDDSRGVRFQFRAHVKGREGWPYEPGTSRPVIVTGR
jgi:hypothetical protein